MSFLRELITGRHANHPSVTERYTEATRRALNFARIESLRRGAPAITTADLLAGLSVDEDSRAERIGSLKTNAFYLRWLVGLPAQPARAEESIEIPEMPLDDSRLEFDLEATRALGFAVLEADRDREYWIDTDHLLRGILRFPNKADFAILKIEVDLDSAREASKADRHRHPALRNPSLKVAKYLIRKHMALWVPPILSLVCYLYILIQGIKLTVFPLAR
jgi:hypothetical protein